MKKEANEVAMFEELDLGAGILVATTVTSESSATSANTVSTAPRSPGGSGDGQNRGGHGDDVGGEGGPGNGDDESGNALFGGSPSVTLFADVQHSSNFAGASGGYVFPIESKTPAPPLMTTDGGGSVGSDDRNNAGSAGSEARPGDDATANALFGGSPSVTLSADVEYSSNFARFPSGYVFPNQTTKTPVPPVQNVGRVPSLSASWTSREHQQQEQRQSGDDEEEEGEEHTVENFHHFLEISSMTTNSCDHVLATTATDRENANESQSHNGPKKAVEEPEDEEYDDCPTEDDVSAETTEGGSTAAPIPWPERLLRSPDHPMADAPSGILLVFDRMLDCIDPGGSRGPKRNHGQRFGMDDECDYEYESIGYETDSVWSVSIDRSRLIREFAGGAEPPLAGAEWLDDGLDCVFPCWKPEGTSDPSHHSRALADAFEAGRKRKWAEREHEEERGCGARPEDRPLRIPPSFGSDSGDGCDGNSNDHDEEEKPFDFPTPEFPPPVWKRAVPAAESGSNQSGSSLSELFDGLVFGPPSDEDRDDDDDDELENILDRNSETESVTEETSTLGYSSGTV